MGRLRYEVLKQRVITDACACVKHAGCVVRVCLFTIAHVHDCNGQNRAENCAWLNELHSEEKKRIHFSLRLFLVRIVP